jgi:hypothetical protein
MLDLILNVLTPIIGAAAFYGWGWYARELKYKRQELAKQAVDSLKIVKR